MIGPSCYLSQCRLLIVVAAAVFMNILLVIWVLSVGGTVPAKNGDRSICLNIEYNLFYRHYILHS